MTFVREEVSLFQRLLWLANTIFHQLVAIVTVFVFWICFKNYDLDNALLWHIVLSTGAYVPLMAEAIILFAGDNLWTQELDRPKKYWLHGILLGISIVSVTIGIGYEINRKNESGRPHFVSNHALTGLVSWIFAFLSIVLGLFSWHSQKLKSLARPVLFKFVHNFLGIGCFAIGVSSLCLGFELGGFSRFVTEKERDTTIAITAIVAIWSCLAALKSAYNQLKNTVS
ncbi:hypothetical protein NQ318_001317 [Aromia moschata]|uniref:ascorbate ferrireductase (transmembrane) n=1 Tax=Aromia moschata TaxID=1265417 RepID=A0AAV8ZEU1_9CUCU|nr:hypothetical protein NQ318_001317 [Aromia moschata]